MRDEQINNLIKIRIEEGLRVIDEKIAAWLRAHLTQPRPVQVIINYELGTKKTFWLVTDHTGQEDCGKRIVYDPQLDRFGLITTTMHAEELLLGSYKNLADTLYSL